MKKLMTMLAAAAMAFGLYADHQDPGFISGTSFESGDGGTSGDIDSSWWTKPAVGEIAVVAGKHGFGTANRPAEYLGQTDANVLNLKTTLGNPAGLKSSSIAGGLPLAEGNIYFDGLVNMTVFDEVPGEYSDAKIAVYLLQTNEEESVKFMVRATNGGTAEDFECLGGASSVDWTTWHRLTIKTIADIGTGSAGFVIFVDGVAVSCEDAILSTTGLNLVAQNYNEGGKLFLPLATTTAIAGVAFDGQGSVDELVFTKNAPTFAADPQVAELVFDAEKGASFMYSTVAEPTDGDWVEATSPLKFGEGAIAFPANGKVWLKWDGSETYCGNKKQYDITSGKTTTVPDSDYTAAKASFNDIGYATLAEAVAATTGGNGTLKLLEDAAYDVLKFTANTITLDLNGYTVAAGDPAQNVSIQFTNAKLTIAGTGKVEGLVKKGGMSTGTIAFTLEGAKFATDINNFVAADQIAVKGEDNYYVVTEAVTVTFDLQGHGTAIDPVKVAKGSDVTQPTTPTETGWTFGGWYQETTCENEFVFTAVSASATAYAKWEQDVTPVIVTVSFDPTSAEWSETGSLQNPTITFEPTGSYTKDQDYTVAFTDAAGKEAQYPIANPTEDQVFTCTVTMTGKYSGSGFATFTVTKKAEEKPVEPGQEIKTDKTPEQINADTDEGRALKKKLLKAPEGATVGDDYYGLFDAVKGDTDGTVKFELNDAGKKAVADSIAEQIKPAEGEPALDPAKVADGTQTSMTVANPIVGFYYAIKQDAALKSMKVTACTLANGKDAVQFKLTKGDASGFYEILCSPTAIAVENNE